LREAGPRAERRGAEATPSRVREAPARRGGALPLHLPVAPHRAPQRPRARLDHHPEPFPQQSARHGVAGGITPPSSPDYSCVGTHRAHGRSLTTPAAAPGGVAGGGGVRSGGVGPPRPVRRPQGGDSGEGVTQQERPPPPDDGTRPPRALPVRE